MNREHFNLRQLTHLDLKQIFDWRNSDRVRFNMFESEHIVWENHLKWFKNLQDNSNSKALIFEFRGERLGVINAKAIQPEEKRWIWGCYLGDRGIFTGAGTIMGFMALEYCFEVLGVETLIGEMLKTNEISAKFNTRIGFKTIRHFVQKTSTGRLVPATLLEQTRQEWLENKPAMLKRFFKES